MLSYRSLHRTRSRTKFKSKDDSEIVDNHNKPKNRSSSVPVRLYSPIIRLLLPFYRPTEPLNGYYTVIIADKIHFEGLFNDSRRFGPGVLTYLNSMYQTVGWWYGNEILRLCKAVCPGSVPSLCPPRVDYSPKKDFKKLETFRRNMASILFTCESCDLEKFAMEFIDATEANTSTEPIQWSCINLESMLETKHASVIVRKCGLEKTQKYSTNMEIFRLLAHAGMMSEIFEFALEHLDEETFFNVRSFVGNSRYEYGKPSKYEKFCVEFLTTCANGDKEYFRYLIENCNINPNICDGRGNSGLMFAASKDKIEMIYELARTGADFNMVNDDGLSALSIVLLRFIALVRKVQNWNQAFGITVFPTLQPIIKKHMDSRKKNDIEKSPKKHQSGNKKNAIVPNDEEINFSEIFFCYHDKEILSLEERRNMPIEQIFGFYGLHLPAVELQNFQNNYSNPGTKENYVFDFNLKRYKKEDQKMQRKHIKNKRGLRYIDNETFLRLAVVFNTLVILLHYGSNPCISSHTNFSIPPLFLGLFTEHKDVLQMLLNFGAEPSHRLRSYYNITPLQALASMHPGKYQSELANILLKTSTSNELVNLVSSEVLLGLDFSINMVQARTDPNHWWEERRWAVGNYKEILDSGKTVLHILAMRCDFKPNPIPMKNLAEVFICKHANLSKKYLGHLPLTLAMLRGNVTLVKTLLKYGSSPNTLLGNKMGKAITILLLNRFKDQLPPLETCKEILKLLMDYGGDPFESVYNLPNAFEFLYSENYKPVKLSVKTKSSFRKTSKMAKCTPTSATLHNIMLKYARQILLKHYQCLMFLALFLTVKRGFNTPQEVGFNLNLSGFMNIGDTMKIIQYLMYYQILDLKNMADYNALIQLFDSIIKHDDSKRSNSKESKIKMPKLQDIVSTLHYLEPLEPTGFTPELDIDFEKYIVCFSCCMKTKRKLLTCPSCGLIHFCCRTCERYCRKNGMHSCNSKFYSDEKSQFKFCEEHNIRYEGMHDEEFKSIRIMLQHYIEEYNNTKY